MLRRTRLPYRRRDVSRRSNTAAGSAARRNPDGRRHVLGRAGLADEGAARSHAQPEQALQIHHVDVPLGRRAADRVSGGAARCAHVEHDRRPVRGLERRADHRAGEHGAREHEDVLDILFRTRGFRRHGDQPQGQDDRHQRLPHQHRALCTHRGCQGRPRPGTRREVADRAAAADGRSAAPEENRRGRLSLDLRVSRHAGRRGEEGVRLRRHQRHRGRVRRRLQPGLHQEASGGGARLGFGLRRPDALLRGEAGRGAQEPHRLQGSFRPIRRSTSP